MKRIGNMVEGRIAGAVERLREFGRRRGWWALPLLLLAAAGTGTAARADDFLAPITPLRVEPDVNGVNIVTGKIQIDPPALSVPAAPRLKFDRVQNSAPFFKGRVTGSAGNETRSYTVHIGDIVSESFTCPQSQACWSVAGTGSAFWGVMISPPTPGSLSVWEYYYRQAGTGAVYHFTRRSSLSQGHEISTYSYYASKVEYPDGETIDYQQSAITVNQVGHYRTTAMISNLGYRIDISYQGNVFPDTWAAPKEAVLTKSSDPGTPLGRLTYSGTTVTDLGGRVYACGCNNVLGGKTEVVQGSMTLPGEASPALQISKVTAAQVVNSTAENPLLVGSVTRDGVTWNYTYYNVSRDQEDYFKYYYTKVIVTGPNGYRVIYELNRTDDQNVITAITQRVSGATTRETKILGYNLFRPTRIVHPEGNETLVGYDQHGNVVDRVRKPKPQSGLEQIEETASVDAATCSGVLCYRPKWSKDGRDNVTHYSYNIRGQLATRTDPATGGRSRMTYISYETVGDGISRRRAVNVCDDTVARQDCGTIAGTRTSYQYLGNTFLPTLERRFDAELGLTLDTRYSYDDAGRLLSVDGPLSGTDDATHVRYDEHGRKEWEIGAVIGTNGLRPATRYEYRDADDKVELVETGTVSNLANPAFLQIHKRAATTYNAQRRPVRETVTAGGAVQQLVERSFRLRGEVECEAVRMNPAISASPPTIGPCQRGAQGSDGLDRITHNTYDDAGQLLIVKKAYDTPLAQNYARYEYSPNGKRTSVTDANGNRAEMAYDGHDRQSRWTFPSRSVPGEVRATDYEAYTYDENDNRLSLRKRDGSTLVYSYDALNRMTKKAVPFRADLAATHRRDVYYGYDLRDLMTYARFDETGVHADGVTNVYDGFGRLRSSRLIMDGVGRTLSYEVDDGGRRTRITHPGGQAFTYQHDAAGRLSGVYEGIDTAAPLAQFGYDGKGRLESRSEAGGSGVFYGYDAVGRLAWQTDRFVGGTGDVRIDIGRYNRAGQIMERTRANLGTVAGQADLYAWTGQVDAEQAYDANGLNQYSRAGPATLTYDANGNLASETAPEGTTAYVYDVENRLVQASGAKTASLRYDPLGRLYQLGGTATRRFLYDGDALVAEYTGSGALAERYVHGTAEGVDDPLVWYDGSVKRWLHADHQGSIVAMTDGAGAMHAINAYDEYGVPKSVNGVPANVGRFQYTGQAWIPELGMYHYKARVYAPKLGRFLQVDPVGYEDNVNLYAYTNNDPVNRLDPLGKTDLYIGGFGDIYHKRLRLRPCSG